MGSSSLIGYFFRSQKGFLLSTSRLSQDQEIGSRFLPGCFIRSQKGIPSFHQEASLGSGDGFKLFVRLLLKEQKGVPALHQEASPESGEGLFRVFVMNAPQSATLLVAERCLTIIGNGAMVLTKHLHFQFYNTKAEKRPLRIYYCKLWNEKKILIQVRSEFSPPTSKLVA